MYVYTITKNKNKNKMENYKRLQIVMSELIELQWSCKGMIGDKKKWDVYEKMIQQSRQLQLLEK